MILLALTGAIGHGKSTFAEALHIAEPSLLHLETNMPIIDMANDLQAAFVDHDVPKHTDQINAWLSILPYLVAKHTKHECTVKDVTIQEQAIKEQPDDYAKLLEYLELLRHNPELATEHIAAANKDKFRPILQWLGGFLIQRIDPLIWTGAVVERAREYEQANGVLAVIGGIRFPAEAALVTGAGGIVIRVTRPGFAEPDLADPTERQRSDIQATSVVINNGTVTDLLPLAEKLLADVRANTLRAEYRAA